MRILESYFRTGITAVNSERQRCLSPQPARALGAEKLRGGQNFLQDSKKEGSIGNTGSLRCNLLRFLTDIHLNRSGFY